MAAIAPPPRAVSRGRGHGLVLLLGLLLIAVVAVAAVVLVALRVTAPSADEPTVWQAITAGITDGPVPKDVALEAFAYEFGVTIPGVTIPAGRDGDDVPDTGSGAVRWVQGAWDQLTPDQQAVIAPYLAPGPGDTVIPIEVPGYTATAPAPAGGHVVLADDDPLRDAIVADLTADLAHLGPRLGLPPIVPTGGVGTSQPLLGEVSLVISNESPSHEGRGSTLLYTYAAYTYHGPSSDPNSPFNLYGRYSYCNVVVYRPGWEGEQAVDGQVSDRLHVLLTHEAVHCYQQSLTDSAAAVDKMPSWISEGSAAWLAADDTRIEEPNLPGSWRDWFEGSDTSLFKREYDAVGFYALLDHLGRNLWSLMVPAWRAAYADPSNASTAFLDALGGDNQDVQEAWAPSLARRSDWAGPWEAHGFGLHPDAQANVYVVAATAAGETGTVAGHAARLAEVPSVDGEIVTVSTTGLVSAHDDDNNEVLAATTGTFCTVDSCVCPPGTARAGESVADQPMRVPFMLAFYAPVDGTTYTVTGHHLSDLCGLAPTPLSPLGGGGGGGSDGGGGGPDETDPCSLGCAKSNGDPHLVTIDGHLYDFQAAGEFTLLRSPDGSDEIQARQVPWPGSDHLAINQAVAVQVGSHRVGIYVIAGRSEIHVDGQVTAVDAPIDLAGGGRLVPYPAGIEIDFPDGTRAWAIVVGRWGLMARIAPSASLATAGVGLLGPVRGDGLPALPDGSTVPDTTDPNAEHEARYGAFADAWRVTDATSLFDHAPGTSSATFAIPGFPAEVAGSTLAELPPDQRAAGEQACAAIVAPDLHDACVFDAGATGEADAADAYALAQSFDSTGTAALAGAPSAPASPPSQETAPPEATMPAGVAELVPAARALLGQALGPSDRLYLSVGLADGTDAVLSVDGLLVTPPVQVPLDGGGPVAFAGSAVAVGETRADGTCAIVRLEPHALVTAATVPIPCDQGHAAIAALGDDLWYVDTAAVTADGTGAVLRRLDPSNQPSSTSIPIPIPIGGTTLSEGTGATSIVLSSPDRTLFLANGATGFADLGPLAAPVFGVSAGAWAADSSGGTATLHGPAGTVATVQLDGHLVGADDNGVLVELPGSTEDTLSRLAPGGGYPVLIGSGSQVDTAAGTTVPLGYHDDWPLVVGADEVVKLWLPTSRINPSALAVDAQWSSLR